MYVTVSVTAILARTVFSHHVVRYTIIRSFKQVMNWTYKLRHHQHKTYAAIQGRLAEYWALYTARDLTTSALLRKCSRIYGLVNN